MQICKQDVISAIQNIRTRNEVVNTVNIRKELGNQGSYSTIGRLLNEITAEESAVAEFMVNADPECEKFASMLIKQIWAKVAETVQCKFKEQIEQLQKQINILTNENNSLSAELDEYHAKALKDSEQLKSVNLQLGEYRGTAEALKSEITRLHALVDDLTSQLINQNMQLKINLEKQQEESDKK